jgi:hypothetical protein
MAQYIALIQGNTKSSPASEEWEAFFATARQSGLFKGGSALGARTIVGDVKSATSTDHVVGYMRFDSDDQRAILELLAKHPVVVHGGSMELCEMPSTG